MDVLHMTYLKNTTAHKLKKNKKKHPVYEDESDTRRKVIIVRETLMENFKIRTILAKFLHMLYYCRPTMELYKKLTKKHLKNKNRPIIAIIGITSGHSSFKI